MATNAMRQVGGNQHRLVLRVEYRTANGVNLYLTDSELPRLTSQPQCRGGARSVSDISGRYQIAWNSIYRRIIVSRMGWGDYQPTVGLAKLGLRGADPSFTAMQEHPLHISLSSKV